MRNQRHCQRDAKGLMGLGLVAEAEVGEVEGEAEGAEVESKRCNSTQAMIRR
jgi:hypothetical protein